MTIGANDSFNHSPDAHRNKYMAKQPCGEKLSGFSPSYNHDPPLHRSGGSFCA
jgi:hypothetical protein